MSDGQKKQLTYDLIGAYQAGEHRHPLVVMRLLEIRCEHATPQSMGDAWWFWNCEYDCDLPPFIRVTKRDPMECIGFGLNEDMARRLAGDK